MTRTNFNRSPISTLLPFTVTAVLITAIGCSTFGTKAKSEALAAYEEGEAFYESGAYAEAIPHFLRVVTEHPNNPLTEVATYYLAKSYVEAGRIDEAVATYNNLIEKFKIGFWVNSSKKEVSQLKGVE